MSQHKTDYFGPFLDALARGTAKGTSTAAAVSATAAASASENNTQDSVIGLLASHHGAMPVKDLLTPPFTSLGTLMAVIREMQSFGFVTMENGIVHLTDDGMSIAMKLGMEPAGIPGARPGQ